jgi:phospholipid/cholesterol/gamma-HCH transport system substrate-binding protein
MSKFRISKEFRVGIFAIISLTILYIGFNYLKGIEFLNKTEQYYTVYEDVAGLTVSNPVKINGFSVGRVSDVKILQERNNQILVELDVTNDIILGEGTNALLQIDLLGGVSIILDVGDISKPLTPGDTIKSSVDPTLAELLAESALPVADNLQVTIRRINALLETISSDTSQIKRIADNVEGITYRTNALIEQNQASIKEMTANFASISKKLDIAMTNLGPVIEKYGVLADSLQTIDLNETLASTNALLENMNKTIQMMNEGSGTLGRLMQDDSLYINLNQSLIDLDKMLIHMNENPKHFFAPLGKSKKKIEKDLKNQENN